MEPLKKFPWKFTKKIKAEKKHMRIAEGTAKEISEKHSNGVVGEIFIKISAKI